MPVRIMAHCALRSSLVAKDGALFIPVRYPKYNIILALSPYLNYVSYSYSNTSSTEK